jgi:hypothetical protein
MNFRKFVILCAWLSLLAASAVSAQSIVGAWSGGDTTKEGSGVMVFFANGSFYYIENVPRSEAPYGVPGYERGTYAWNAATGALALHVLQDNNKPNTGIDGADGVPGITATISGSTLTISVPGGGSIVGTRVTGASPIVGAWSYGDAHIADRSAVVVFLPNGVYFMAQDGDSTPATGDPSGHDGIEIGTYSWDSATGTMTSSRTPAPPYIDTNGEWGLSNITAASTIKVSADSASLVVFDGVETTSLVRADTTVTVVEYHHASFDHYFITPVAGEIALLDAKVPPFQDWSRTGHFFNAYVNAGAPAGSVAICRFFNDHFAPKSSHFYALRGFGCEATLAKFPDWGLEDDKLFNTMLPDATSGACPAGTIPVYRLYNNGMGNAPNHRFVTELAEQQKMVSQGWVAEGAGIGVGMCVPG